MTFRPYYKGAHRVTIGGWPIRVTMKLTTSMKKMMREKTPVISQRQYSFDFPDEQTRFEIPSFLRKTN